MAEKDLEKLIQQADLLTPEDRRELIEHLLNRSESVSRRKWAEIAGTAPYPMAGEDAQEWVSRTRKEGSRKRERQWSETE